MKRILIALIAGTLAAGAGAGQALADAAPPAAPSQTVAQLAGNHQSADASATSTQIKPENTNVAVRVLSPGSSGSVSQSNTSAAAALAANANQLAQSAPQNAGVSNPGGHGAPIQSAGQVAASKQDADAWADSTQVKPKNTNVSVRVLSPGDDGDVTQENSSAALGLALNKNDTAQTASQDAGTGSPVQTAAQAAKNDQDANASAESKQIEPKNTNVSVRVLSEGDNGSVAQKNTSKAIGIGANLNRTEQTTTQSGSGHGSAIQDAAQVAKSEQDADAWADSVQVKPTNKNVSVRALSPGDDGDVSQENNSFALGIAANKNHTDQTVTEEQDGRYGDVAVQAAGQIASNDQDAWASADSVQIKPENSNLSVRTLDLDKKGYDAKDGDGGEVSQTNSSKALALSLNASDLVQTADQSRGGDEGITAGPSYREPSAFKPKDDRKDHPKEEPKEDEEDGGVSQLNTSFAAALSANFNRTMQTATQSHGDGKSDVAVQASGQVAGNEQRAGSKADSFQFGATNTNGGLTGSDLCKHDDLCKPNKPDCKDERCKPEKPECEHDRCKPDHGKPCDGRGHPKCKPGHDRPWPASRQVMPDVS